MSGNPDRCERNFALFACTVLHNVLIYAKGCCNMPYDVMGLTVESRRSGRRWHFKDKTKQKRWLQYNRAKEHGWTPTRSK